MTDHDHATADPFAERQRAPAWTPKPGEALIGRIVGFAIWDAGWGPYPIVVVERDDGESVAVHAQRRVLSSELAKLQPVADEPIAIRYDGEVDRRDGSGGSYHRYTVRMPGRSPLRDGLDWSRWGTEGNVR
jgi:hypothetical protein